MLHTGVILHWHLEVAQEAKTDPSSSLDDEQNLLHHESSSGKLNTSDYHRP